MQIRSSQGVNAAEANRSARSDNPFDLSQVPAFQQGKVFSASRMRTNKNARTEDAGRQQNIEQMLAKIEQQQREIEKLQQQQQQVARVAKANPFASSDDLRAVEAAIGAKSGELAGLNGRLSQLMGSQSIGGFVGAQASTGNTQLRVIA